MVIDYDFGSEEEKPSEPQARPQQDAAAQLSLITYSLLRSRTLAINCGILGALMGFVQGALQQNVYQASGKLLVRAGMREASTAEVDPLGGGILTSTSSASEAVNTELHLLASPELFRMVAREVGGAKILKMRDPRNDDNDRTPAPTRLLHEFQAWWFGLERSDEELDELQGNPENGESLGNEAEELPEPPALIAAAGRAMRGRIRSVPSRGSSVIDVVYQGQTPEIAQEVVSAFLRLAADYHRKVFTSEAQLDFLRDQGIKKVKASNDANAAFTAFKLENEIYDLEAQKSNNLSSIIALERKMADDRLMKISLRNQLKFFELTMEREDPDKLEQAALTPNPEYSQIRADLRSARRESLLEGVRRPSEPDSQFKARKKHYDDEVSRLESELLQVEKFLPAENPRYIQLVNQRDLVLGQLAALDGVREEQLLQLEAYKARRDALQAAEFEYLRLMYDADEAVTNLDATNMGIRQLEVMNLLDKEELGNLRILQDSTDNEYKISPDRARVLKMGGVMGVAIGVMLALVRGLLDPLLRRPREIPGLGGQRVLGVVKELGRKYQIPAKAALLGGSDWARITNSLWAHLASLGRKPGGSLIAFTGLSRGTGVSSSVSCAGLGLAMRLQEEVLIIETDFENPGLAYCLDMTQGPGLVSVLAGTEEFEAAVQRTSVPGLSILDVGQEGHPGPGWFASDRAQNLLRKAREKYKFVLLDLAPPDEDPESRLLVWSADAIVPVVPAGKAKKSELRQYLRGLEESRVQILGTIFNRYRSARPFWLPGADAELVVAQPLCAPPGAKG